MENIDKNSSFSYKNRMEKHKARKNEHIKFSSWFASKFPKFQKWKFPQAAKCRQLTTEPIAYDDVKSILKKSY